jgi:hypothetical protein
VLHTTVISSSISIIRLGAMIKTMAQQPHASTDEKCADHRGNVELQMDHRELRKATHVIRFLVTLVDLFRNHGAAAPTYGAMVRLATCAGDPRN